MSDLEVLNYIHYEINSTLIPHYGGGCFVFWGFIFLSYYFYWKQKWGNEQESDSYSIIFLSVCWYILLASLQVKVAILKYIETLAKQMDPGDFVNSSETRLAVSRVITWTTEPKSSDVRKVCVVLFFLFCAQVFRGLCSAEDQTPIYDLQCATTKYEHLRCVFTEHCSLKVWLHSKRAFEPQQTP